MTQNFLDNTLYEMDNLVVLRGMNSETVDLIATDPPFNTKRNRSGTAGEYEDKWTWLGEKISKRPDQWKWNEIHPKWLEEIEDNHKALHSAIKTAEVCQDKDTAAFLCFISVRLLEMHRILKPTGSIYLHCDATVGHYIKMCMDAIFGKKNFLNEIIWHYDGPQRPSQKNLGRKHDTIFRYARSDKFYANSDEINPIRKVEKSELNEYRQTQDGTYYYDLPKGSYSDESIKRLDREGRIRWTKNGNPRVIYFLSQDENGDWWRKKQRHDVWSDILSLGQQGDIPEKTGSPDQKPVSLYERIIQVSSKEDDLVLDPFCGCATTIIAANKLKRRWIGIDRRKDARLHIVTRLYFAEQDRINESQGKKPIPKKERKRIKKQAEEYPEWLDKQIARYEMHYQIKPPIRTDNGEQNIAELPAVYIAEPENLLSHDEMKEILIKKFGEECWGCGFQPPEKDHRYLHLVKCYRLFRPLFRKVKTSFFLEIP